jgi:type IV pilus assembly protein PilO
VPTQPEIPTLVVQIEEVEEVADAADVTLLSIQPGTLALTSRGSDYSVVPITMSFEGPYEQLQLFLENIRNLTRLVTINKLTYEKDEKATREGNSLEEIEQTLRVWIKAEVYFLPLVEPFDVPAGPAPTAPLRRRTRAPEETTTAL